MGQPVIGALVLSGIYYKWGSLMPLCLQMIMTPLQLYEAPLTQIYFTGKDIKRPFPAPNMFGLPQAPQPAAEEEEEEETVEDDAPQPAAEEEEEEETVEDDKDQGKKE